MAYFGSAELQFGGKRFEIPSDKGGGGGGGWGGATVWITALGAAAAAASPHGCVLNLLRFIHTQSSYWLLEVAALAPWTQ